MWLLDLSLKKSENSFYRLSRWFIGTFSTDKPLAEIKDKEQILRLLDSKRKSID
jgi:hypothetical protein